jgi:hypothetical protein
LYYNYFGGEGLPAVRVMMKELFVIHYQKLINKSAYILYYTTDYYIFNSSTDYYIPRVQSSLSTLTDPMIQNISTIVTLTNAEKSEKYSNDVRSDLDMKAILPNSLAALNETSVPPPSPPSPLPPPASTVNNG